MPVKITLSSLLILLFWKSFLISQSLEDHAFFIKNIYNHSLTESKCYDWLNHLSENIGARMSGSENYDQAVKYTVNLLEELNMDTVFTQPCEVDYWERGNGNIVEILKPDGETWKLNSSLLGKSVGTGGKPITGEVVEVKSLEEVERLGSAEISGKIVFYNRPMDPTQVRTFYAYGGAVDQRVFGASKASEYGGIGALVRSMTTRLDDVPHTGTMAYQEGVKPVPAMSISTNDAELLSQLLKSGSLSATITANSRMAATRISHNVIAEIRGTVYPDEIILVGGHLDSWDVGGGAHDDGAGCVHALQVLHTLLSLEYKPQRTIRCVLFANEENGLAGAMAYAEKSNQNGEYHLAAIESDAGGFTPRGFSVDGHAEVFEQYAKVINDLTETYLEPYGLLMTTAGSGADINPLKSQKGILIGLRPDSQRYFDYHHTENDRIDAVNPRELQLGAAAMTSLVYLIDQYGLN